MSFLSLQGSQMVMIKVKKIVCNNMINRFSSFSATLEHVTKTSDGVLRNNQRTWGN